MPRLGPVEIQARRPRAVSARMAPDQRELLTSSRAARLLGVSVATLKRWASAGLVASDRTAGGHRRFRLSELRPLVEAGEGGAVQRRADALLAPQTPLATQQTLLHMKLEAGSWWEFAESLRGVVSELHRRHRAGALSTVDWLQGFDRLCRALYRFRDQVPYRVEGPAVLIASVPADRVLIGPALLALGAHESRWSPRPVGGLSPRELAEELRREPVDAAIVSGGTDVDPLVMARYAQDLVVVAHKARTPLAVLGEGSWPDPLPGAVRLGSFLEAHRWLDGVAPSHDPPREAVVSAEPVPPAMKRDARGERTDAERAPGPVWKPSMALGSPLIDEQHRLLFEHARRFTEAAQAGALPPGLQRLLGFLGNYAQAHFRLEESLMRTAKYPDCEAHAREHAGFARDLEALANRLKAEGESEPLRAEAVEFVRSWLIEHVSSSDQRIARHLRTRAGRA